MIVRRGLMVETAATAAAAAPEHRTLRATSHLLVAIPVGIPEAVRRHLITAATAPTRRLPTTTIVPPAITILRPTGVTLHHVATTRRRTAATRLHVRTHPHRPTRPRGAAAPRHAATLHRALLAADSAAVRIAAVAVVEVADRTLAAVVPLTAVAAITNSEIL